MKLSSRSGVRCGGLIGLVVAQHRPHDVEAAAGKCQHGLGVAFPFGAFAVDEIRDAVSVRMAM